MEKTVAELFAGVGGFRVGLNDIKEYDQTGRAIERRDWKFVWANQWEPSTQAQHAFDCYVKRFGVSEGHSNEDITSVNKMNIPDHSLLVGGFPCQDYSVARSKVGEKGIEGKKGVLFWQIVEILEAKRTPFVLLENVDRLLKSPAIQRGRDFGIMLRTFSDMGYNVEWRIINAADYGCAQRRRRIFIFAWKKALKYNSRIKNPESAVFTDTVFAKSFPLDTAISMENPVKKLDINLLQDTVEMTQKFTYLFENSGIMIDGIILTRRVVPVQKEPITLREIRDPSTDLSKYFLNDKQIEQFKFLKDGKRIQRFKPNGDPYFYSEGGMGFPDDLDLPGRTMLTSEASINRSTHVIEDLSTRKLRFITPLEAERMQSFPDDWTNTGMPENRRYFMMGNALVTKVINIMESELNAIITSE